MAAGAIVAIVAAARARRHREITDAFRGAEATAPERARTLAALGLTHSDDVAELAREGVLVEGAAPDTWYLSEAAVAARHRAGERTKRRAIVLAAVLTAVMVVLLGVLQAMRGL